MFMVSQPPIRTYLLLLAALVPMCSASVQAAEPKFPDGPRVATTAAELEAVRKGDDFDKLQRNAVGRGEKLLANPITIPDGWGNWIFYYACTEDGAALEALSPTEHRCRQCGKVHTDERTVTSYRTVLHNRANHAALELGWAFAYSREERFAAEVRRILVAYADAYPSYPARADRWGRTGWLARLGGRRYSQSLSEAVGIIDLAKAYDLVRDSKSLSDKDRRHIEDDFFRPTAETLLYANQGINNHQTWYNAGLMAIAAVLADAKLVDRVLTMRGGFEDQLQRSIGADGYWYEGTMAYHNYALQAMLEIVRSGERIGLPLAQQPGIRKMLEAPLSYAYPDGRFPAINDSDPSNLRSFAAHFEWAWNTYQEPRWAQAAAWQNPPRLTQLLGPDAKPEPVIDQESRDLAGTGLAVLRRGSGDAASCVMLDYGPHGGGHGHPDKLNLILYAGGREWLLDPGRLSYSHAEHKTWYKQTVAHNTVTLGRDSQWPHAGKLLWLKQEPQFTAARAESRLSYLGAVFTRSLLLTDDLLVDEFQVHAPRETTIDWLAHAVADQLKPVADNSQGEQITPGKANGYEHLRDGRSYQLPAGTSAWEFVAGTNRLRMWLLAAVPETVITSIGLGYNPRQPAPCLIRRIEGKSARFVTVYDWSSAGDRVTGLDAAADGTLRITTQSGTGSVRFSDDGPAWNSDD